jgi:hypothetical protein
LDTSRRFLVGCRVRPSRQFARQKTDSINAHTPTYTATSNHA